MSGPRPRLLVFVISYFAESTLRKVLERIPGQIFEDFDAEVLVVDDASTDRTFEIGHDYRLAHPHIPMTVLRNEQNQGYGGNQKVGYTFAIQRGFDLVAMVHGDGQYAPEALPMLTEPLTRGRADAVFGSRMLEPKAALKGGMPLYKYVGNKILTRLQNTMLGTRLSEFHSGYRIYSVPMLAKLPYRLNSNDFHFDTEIIIQLLNAEARIVELPIPTYYGDEICRVNGMKYAKDVLQATLANTAHRAGLLYQRRFDTTPPDNSHYDLKLGYASSHTYALDAVPRGSKVLDIGSGPGGLAQELEKRGCEVTVVDQHAPSAPIGKTKVIVQDLEGELQFDVHDYDVLLLLDVIEHLKSPEAFLERLRAQFDHDQRTLVLTTPNIAFVVQRLMLALGQFNYGKAGILDRTHTRLFNFRAIEALLVDEGFKIKQVRGVPAPFPKVLGNGVLGKAAVSLNEALIRLSKTLFSYQIYVEAETRPSVEFLVHDAIERSRTRAELLELAKARRAG
ncbi:MAG: glycosyltransferase [Deltaproteobacteria bacterium]|nr:glycosyltransferase [Deltaproteobacteria bacterium]